MAGGNTKNIAGIMILTIKDIVRESHDTRTYIFESSANESFSYKAGQFITLIINRNGRELRRSYSLSSSPGYDDYLAFTIKLVPNGEISRYLFQSLHKGSQLTALAPAGRFVPPDQVVPGTDIYLITAGSGITPIFSLLKYFVRFTSGAAIKLIVQNRTENDFIFSEPISLLASEHPEKLKVFDFLSNPSGDRTPQRINNEQLEQIVHAETTSSGRTAVFYICGPLSFMRMVLFTLKTLGIGNNDIKREIFDVPPAGKPSVHIDPTSRSVKLFYNTQEHNFTIHYPQTILDAALQLQLPLPYSCRAGICGSCVVRCTDGLVHMKQNEVLTEEEVRKGLVLSCVSYALTDITLSTS